MGKEKYTEYARFYKDINAKELVFGFLGHGMFSGRLVPMFSSVSFCDYVKIKNNARQYESFRSFSLPSTFECPRPDGSSRTISIPDPIAYWREILVIKEYWNNLVAYFQQKTKKSGVTHSLIHIEKNDQFLFSMSPKSLDNYVGNYSMMLDANYVAYADVSSFFPSIYTHSIEWALKGKTAAKKRIALPRNRRKDNFGSCLDEACRLVCDNQTKGLPIGPHASNLIGEVILCYVDEKMERDGYKNFIRYIDDYYFYATTKEEAKGFISSLGAHLAEMNLLVNSKKVRIDAMPSLFVEPWLSEILSLETILERDQIDQKLLGAFFDKMSLLMEEHKNASILKHGMKYISGKKDCLSPAAIELLKLQCKVLVAQYPYVATFVEEILRPFIESGSSWLGPFLSDVIKIALRDKNKTVLSYCVYLSIKYRVVASISRYLKSIFSEAKKFNDPVLLLLTYYLNKYTSGPFDASIYRNAKSKLPKDNEKNEFWIYYYEVLNEADLDGYFKILKRNGVTFVDFNTVPPIETEYRVRLNSKTLSSPIKVTK